MLALGIALFAIPDGPFDLGYTLRFVDVSAHPLAVCNDGSPAAYYIHKGEDADAWVLHQQGGWWCWDDYSCRVRWDHFANHTIDTRTLMSTSDLSDLTQRHDTFNGEKNTGLMAHNVSANPMAKASKVFIVYCSSDSHAGNATVPSPSAPNKQWHFRGKEIVRAIVSELAAQHGLASATRILLTGGSAGGMATLNNADWLGAMLAEIAPRARYLAMPDSGFFLDVMPGAMCDSPDRYECKCAAGGRASDADEGHSWLGRGATLAQQAQAMWAFSGGLPDASCAAHYGRWGAWRCYLGQYAVGHLSTVTLLLQSQIDEWQGFWNGFFSYATDRQAYDYASWFRSETRRLLSEGTAASTHVVAFAPNCYHHGLSYDARFWQVTTNGGWSAATLLAALFDAPTAANASVGGVGLAAVPRLVMDDCEGLPCSPATRGYPECVAVPRPA